MINFIITWILGVDVWNNIIDIIEIMFNYLFSDQNVVEVEEAAKAKENQNDPYYYGEDSSDNNSSGDLDEDLKNDLNEFISKWLSR